MTDNDLIRAFESGGIKDFHHADHVRLAFAYLKQYPALQGLEKFVASLKHFAATHGKPQLYHETITTAYVLLINERLDGAGRDLTWEAFAARHPDLLTWAPSVLDRYYRAETLASPRARATFVLPDRLAPEGAPATG